jgi:hypothetical protein
MPPSTARTDGPILEGGGDQVMHSRDDITRPACDQRRGQGICESHHALLDHVAAGRYPAGGDAVDPYSSRWTQGVGKRFRQAVDSSFAGTVRNGSKRALLGGAARHIDYDATRLDMVLEPNSDCCHSCHVVLQDATELEVVELDELVAQAAV